MPSAAEQEITPSPRTPSTMWRRLILISGHRRSGSTWLASAIGMASQVNQIPYEPLWLKWHPGSPFADQIRQWRRNRGWYIGWDGTSRRDLAAAQALHEHLEWLCGHYFGGPVDTLIVKEPHPNWLEFLLQAFHPDHVVYLHRHPLGIVNSYDKAGLYHRWHIDEEWRAFCDDLSLLQPELVPLAKRANHPAKQVAFMAHLSKLLLPDILAELPSTEVDYEALISQPEERFRDLFLQIGLSWDADTWSRLQSIIKPRRPEVKPGFISVKKRSKARLYAWRRELAQHLITQTAGLFRALGADDPFPGDGLPSLTRKEITNGWKVYLRRRKAYLQQFGGWATLHSL